MIWVRTGVRPEEVRQQRQHVLFVEGTEESVDPLVLGELFQQHISIQTLGPSYSVRSVAEALFPHHPTYYFLIDRDHHDDEFVRKCWDNFPDPETHNLLVWRRREIENYFLDPEYLRGCGYCCVDLGKLKRKILDCANRRLFLDAANHVVVSIREELKRNWITKFTNPDDFPNKKAALEMLKNVSEFGKYKGDVAMKVSPAEVQERFNHCVEDMMGGNKKLSFGNGKWIDRVQGKKILAEVINSNCFRVEDANKKPVMGKAKINEVVKALLKNGNYQPDDFVALRKLIYKRIGEMSPQAI